jgi:hypothetical protein
MSALGNLNSTIPGDPYFRVNRITVDHTGKNAFLATVLWQRRVLTAGGKEEPIGKQYEDPMRITPEMMGQQIQLRNPVTGEPLGASITYGQLVAGIYTAAVLAAEAAMPGGLQGDD